MPSPSSSLSSSKSLWQWVMCFSACVSFCTHFASSLYELLYGAPCHRGWMVLQLLHMWVCAVCGSLYNPPFSSLLVAGSGGGHTMLDANLFLGEGLSSYDYVKSHHVARAGTLHCLCFRSADSVENWSFHYPFQLSRNVKNWRLKPAFQDAQMLLFHRTLEATQRKLLEWVDQVHLMFNFQRKNVANQFSSKNYDPATAQNWFETSGRAIQSHPDR